MLRCSCIWPFHSRPLSRPHLPFVKQAGQVGEAKATGSGERVGACQEG